MGFGTQYSMPMTAAIGSASVSLQRAFTTVYLMIPSMPSLSSLDVYAGVDGSSYYQVRRGNVNTLTVQAASFCIAGTAGANGGIVPLPPGFKYYKIIADSVPTTTLGFQVICGNE